MPYYTVTDKGHQFRLRRATKPVTRARCQLLLTNAVAACHAINADGTLPLYVRRLYVFGSYLTDKPMLGDLDLALECAARIQGLTDAQWNAWLLEYGAARANTFFAQLSAADTAVRSRIKNRSRTISIHTLNEVNELKAKKRKVFTATQVAPPTAT